MSDIYMLPCFLRGSDNFDILNRLQPAATTLRIVLEQVFSQSTDACVTVREIFNSHEPRRVRRLTRRSRRDRKVMDSAYWFRYEVQ